MVPGAGVGLGRPPNATARGPVVGGCLSMLRIHAVLGAPADPLPMVAPVEVDAGAEGIRFL